MSIRAVVHHETCPTCAGSFSDSVRCGLCPSCLMRLGLAESDDSWDEDDSDELADVEPSWDHPASVAVALSDAPLDGVEGLGTDPIESSVAKAVIELRGEIARGGMGAVFRGYDPRLGRDLAVKILLKRHSGRPDLVRRFLEEAQIAGQLQHPGIAPVYELGRLPEGLPYIAMKLVKGRTLADLLSDRPEPRHDQARLLSIFLQVCQTVAYAHERGVAHRDLKPSNIMVGRFGEVQVMDWGLAKLLGHDDARRSPEALISTASGDVPADEPHVNLVIGTPAYMAPEQASGESKPVDERADVFGLGSILCEILTGSPVYTGRSGLDVYRKAARASTDAAMSALEASGADPEVVTLARDCLREDPELRPRDAGEVASRLEGHLARAQERLREAELARVAADTRTATERSRRRLTTALAAALLAIAALGVGGATFYNNYRQARRARVVAALGRAEGLRDEAVADLDGAPEHWAAARVAVRQVAGLLAEAPDPGELARYRRLADEIEHRLAEAEADRALIVRLEAIRLHDDSTVIERIDADYAAAFAGAGLAIDRDGPESVGRALARRPPGVVRALASSLDDWAIIRTTLPRPPADAPEHWRRLLTAARIADPDPWRNALRNALSQDDRDGLARLADSEDLESRPASSLWLLSRLLDRVGDNQRALRVLLRALRGHSGDFWINDQLATFYASSGQSVSAIRYGTVAAALKPRSIAAHNNLAGYLMANGALVEAEAEVRESRRLRPDHHYSSYLLGCILSGQGRLAEAEAAFRQTLRLKPDCGDCYIGWGESLQNLGRLDQSLIELRSAYERESWYEGARDPLRKILVDLGRLDEAEAVSRESVRLHPEDSEQHFELASVLARRSPSSPEAESEFRAAIRLKTDHARAHRGLVIVFLARGDRSRADEALRQAESVAGEAAEIHRLSDLSDRLTAILRGDEQPSNPDEWTNFAALCRDRCLFVEAARLYSELIKDEPDFSRDPRRRILYDAAVCAVRIGSEAGQSTSSPDISERIRWRRKALEWLRADCESLARYAASGDKSAYAYILGSLGRCKATTDLNAVRDDLALLPEAERGDWKSFWVELDTLFSRLSVTSP